MTNEEFATEREAVEEMAMLGDEHLEAIAALGADISGVQEEEIEDECGLESGNDNGRYGQLGTVSGTCDADPEEGGTESQPGEDIGSGVSADGTAEATREVPADEPAGEAESHAEAPAERSEGTTPAEDSSHDESSAAAGHADKAAEKLKGWKKANKHPYCTLICDHLIRRCREDEGFAQDVLQESKTFAGCYTHIKGEARKMKEGDCACVEDRVVYEWAEDYIRSAEQKPAGAAKTKPEEKTPEKTKKGTKTTKSARKKAKSDQSATETAQKPSELPAPETPDPEPKEVKPEVKSVTKEPESVTKEPKSETKEPKRKTKSGTDFETMHPPKARKEKRPKDEMDGQMDLFSLFG